MNNRYYNIKCTDVPKDYDCANDYHIYLVGKIQRNIDREHNLDVLYRVIYRFIIKQLHKYKCLDSIDNLLAYASTCFMEAVFGFKIDGGSSFLNYFSVCLRNEIQQAYYNRDFSGGDIKYIKKEALSLDYEWDNKSMLDFMIDTGDIDSSLMYKELLGELFGYIDGTGYSELDKSVIKYYVRHKLRDKEITYDMISKRFGISKGYVSKIINKMKLVIKEYIDRMGD